MSITTAQEVPTPRPLDERSSFTRSEATSLTGRLRSHVRTSVDLFVRAYKGRIWLALDYSSWSDYLNAELGEIRPRLPKPQRLELVAAMQADAQMSQRAIAEALGVDQKTVSNDLREVRTAAEASGQTVPDHSVSVGLDGTTRETTPQRRGKPFIEKVTTGVGRLERALDDLAELRADERWDDRVQEIANRHRDDLYRVGELVLNLLDSLPEEP